MVILNFERGFAALSYAWAILVSKPKGLADDVMSIDEYLVKVVAYQWKRGERKIGWICERRCWIDDGGEIERNNYIAILK